MKQKANMIHLLKKCISGYLPMLSVACVILIIGLAATTDHFLSVRNFIDILLSMAIIGILAFGMTMVLISDGIDLSVGSVVAFTSVLLCVSLSSWGLPLPIALCVMTAGAVLVGLVNGFFVSVLKINPFIITLGTMSIVRGLSFITIGGRSQPFENTTVRTIGSEYFLGIPIPIYFMLAILAVLWFLLRYTQFGRNVYAIGNNEETARLSGINVIKTRMLVYGIMGLLAGIAGFLLAARTSTGAPNAGQGYELDALTAAILGGTSLKGGEGRLAGTMLGAFIIAIVLNGQDMRGVPYFYQLVSKGAIILIAMLIARKRV